MRVLHLADEPYDSGITRYALDQASALAGRGHAVWVAGLAGRFALGEAEARGLPTVPLRGRLSALASLRGALKRERIELLVAHTGSAHALAVAAAAGRPVAVLRTRGDARPMRRRPGGRLLFRRSAGFVAANRGILSQMQELYGDLGLPAAVIYQGLPEPGLAPRSFSAGAVPGELSEPGLAERAQGLRVGLVGRLDPVKGHALFLGAAARLRERHPSARFLLVGREENVRIAGLKSLPAARALGESLEIAGHVPDALAAMRRCAVGVVASLGSEAVSRAAVEWMALGRPLVASSVGCLPEYVEPERTGLLFKPGDERGLAAALERLLGDEALRRRLGEAARRRYEELFTFARFAAETESFYERTLHAIPS